MTDRAVGQEVGGVGPRRGPDVLLLLRYRFLQLRNALDQQLRDAPWRTLSVLVLLAVIWCALYMLLGVVLRHVRSWGLVAVIANQHIFVHFFLVLGIMLAFSNAILSFSTLYGRNEAGLLLGTPAHPHQVVCVKWLEGMFLSSWSFLLLGVPLMLAVAANSAVDWYYYPLFLGHFVGFIAIPACLGLLAACAVALWAPRRPLVIATIVGLALLAGAILWVNSISRSAEQSERWVRAILEQLAVARQPLLPSTWTARGIVAAIEQRVGESVFYLLVVLGNAAFVSWLTIHVLARTWPEAYSRAGQGRTWPVIRRGWITEGVCLPLALVMPQRIRRIIVKDLRHFVRDPKQWTQMAIMFGLLVIYVLNLRRLPLDVNHPGTKKLVNFLNLTTVSLILATFTSRFVYPMVSLESQQLWLLELLPLRRVTLLLVKFVFALILTGFAACGVMGIAVHMLGLPPLWALIDLAICLSTCIGLSGMAIGLGARFPVLRQRNPARIAAGFGGTFNLIASMLFVMVQMAGLAAMSLTELRATRSLALPEQLSGDAWAILSGLLALGVVVATGCLSVGTHHFRRLET
jgi:ABC-2 type transport system permease protein